MNNNVTNLQRFDIFQTHMNVVRKENEAAKNINHNSITPPTLNKSTMLIIFNYAVALPTKLEFQTAFDLIDFLLSTQIGLDKTALGAIRQVFEKPYTTPAAQSSIDAALTGITDLIKDHKKEVVFTILQIAKEHMILMLMALPGIDLNAKNESSVNKTPLMYAAEKGFLKTIRFLLQKNVHINNKDNNGWTALIHAASAGHNDIVALLLEKGADINDKNRYGWTALIHAASAGHNEVVALLLEKGANVYDKDYYTVSTALLYATSNGHKDTVALLLKNGANINDKDHHGCTALMHAADNGEKDIVALLLEKGANINHKNNDEQTALMLAKEYGHHGIVEILQNASEKSAANVRKNSTMNM